MSRFRYLLALLLTLASFGAAACGDDDLPDNCGRTDDGEIICQNGGDDGDSEFEED
jgi:hypothetical protein